MSPFQKKYIRNWATIANCYSPILLKSRYARNILAYLSIELGRDRRRHYVVKLLRQTLP